MSTEIQNNRIVIPIELEYDTSKLPAEDVQQDAHIKSFREQQELDKVIGSDDFKKLLEAMQNPEGFFLNLLTRQLPILGGILSAKQIVDFIIEEATRPGGPFDRRFKRIIETEFNNLRDREHNWAVRVGNKQLIITTQPGQRGQGGDTNNLRAIRDDPDRTYEFTIKDKSVRLR